MHRQPRKGIGTRARVLTAAIALLVGVLCFTNWNRIQEQYKHLTARPLLPRCNAIPPEWLASVGRWAALHDLPALQVHLRTEGATYDCTFGSRIVADGSREDMEITTTLPYASLSKIFTSALAVVYMQRDLLHEKQRLYDSLDLHDLELKRPHRWQAITLGMLLRHQGGFDRRRSGDPMIGREPACPEDLKRLEKVRIDFEPGAGYAYSNLGYCLVGLLIERAGNERLPELFQRELFEPLGLPIIHVRRPEDLARQGIFLNPRPEERAMLASRQWHAFDAVGNLAGTARDIGTFLSHLTLDSSPTRSVGRALMEPLEGCDDSAWRRCHGLAFYSYQQPGRPRMYWRDGSLPGVTAFGAVTEDGDVFVLLGNARDPRNWISIHDELGLLVYDHL